MTAWRRWLPTSTAVILGVGLNVVVHAYCYYKFTTQRPCVAPIAYSIGSIDPRFQIERSTVERELKTASAMWSDAISVPLFKKVQSGGMLVHFIYDERQRAVEERNALDKTKESIDAEDMRLKSEHASITAAKWSLEGRQNILSAQGRLYLAELRELGGESDALNKRIDKYNEDSKALNARKDAYNTAIQTHDRNSSSAQGIHGDYDTDKHGNRIIRIFWYTDVANLRMILAHELGHSLMIDHIDDPDSVMRANISGAEKLSKADIDALKKVCNMTYWEYLWEK